MTHSKREGDGGTPVASLRILEVFYRPDRMQKPCSWAQAIGPQDLWSDDVRTAQYNQLVKAPYPFSHERMRRSDTLYDLVLATDWNYPLSKPGLGSAIFIHNWRKPRHPTEGCIAYHPRVLRHIVSQIDKGQKVIVRG